MVRLLHGHLLAEPPHDALPLAIRGPRVVPDAGQLVRERHHGLPRRRPEAGLILVVGRLGGVTRLRQGAPRGMPLRLQHVRDQPVVGGDAESAPLCQLRFILSALPLERPQSRGLGRPRDECIRHGEGQRDRLGPHDLHQEVGDGRLESASGHALTGRFPAGHARALTARVGHDPLPPALVIAHGHPLPAAATPPQPVQEGRALSWGTQALRRLGLTMGGQWGQVPLIGRPRDVADMRVAPDHLPGLAGH